MKTAERSRILIVDDDTDLLRSLQILLMDYGYKVYLATNAEEFRQKAFTCKPDLIILDVLLPGAKGHEVYEELLIDGFDPSIPVVILTGLAQGMTEIPVRPGVTYSLYSKPFNSEKLIKDLETLVHS